MSHSAAGFIFRSQNEIILLHIVQYLPITSDQTICQHTVITDILETFFLSRKESYLWAILKETFLKGQTTVHEVSAM